MAVQMSKTREKYPLSFNKIIKKTITGFIAWFILGIIIISVLVGILIFVSGLPKIVLPSVVGVIVVILLIILIINYIYQRLYFNSYFYDFTDHFIVIRKGVITPKEISIPYERVQDVYVDQDILDRIFRVYDVHLSTATYTSGMEAHIDGLEKVPADGLKEELLQSIHEKIKKKTVVSRSSNETDTK